MAKTLAQAGGATNFGVLPTSQQIAQTSRIESPTIKVGDSLSKDLLSIMGQSGAIIQEQNTLSVKAAQRVATDSLTQMSVDLSTVEADIKPDTDLREVQKTNEAIYQFYGRKTFDNEDAQMAFDRQYHATAAPVIAGKNAKYEQEQNKKDATQLFIGTSNSVSTQINAGLPLDNERYNQYVETMTAGGYYTKEQAGGELIKIVNQSMDSAYKTLDSLDVYQSNGINIDVNKLDREANKYYSGVATIENGEWTPKEGIPASVVDSAQNTFNKLIDNNRKAREQKTGYSAIPEADGGTKLDGSTDALTALKRSKTAFVELEEKMRLNPTIVEKDEFKGWVVHQQKLDAKARILHDMTNNYNMFAKGDITWQDYLNNTAKTTKTFTFAGQEIAVSASEGEATSFAQKQFDNYDDELRKANYTQTLQSGKNVFASAANAEIQSGGALKSNYLQRNATLLSKGNINADSFASLQSEYSKTVDYMSNKKSIDESWLTQTNRANVGVMFNTLSASVERGEITDKQALVKAKSTIEAMQNSVNFQKQKVDPEKLSIINEAFKKFDAEAANTEGLLNLGFGNEVYPHGTKALFVQKFQGDMTSETDADTMKEYVSNNVVPVRSRSGTSSTLTLPFRKTYMIYTGGRKDITGDGASFAIAQRIEKDLGDKFADVSDKTLTMQQEKADNGEIITTIAVRTAIGTAPIRLYSFTMDELAKGEVNKTNKETKGK